MKPISEMTDNEFDKYLKTIKPTLPPWCKDGVYDYLNYFEENKEILSKGLDG